MGFINLALPFGVFGFMDQQGGQWAVIAASGRRQIAGDQVGRTLQRQHYNFDRFRQNILLRD
jgi:hypothetical protein